MSSSENKSPLTKQAWKNYLKSFSIDTGIGLGVGLLTAFVFFGMFFATVGAPKVSNFDDDTFGRDHRLGSYVL